MKTIKVSEASGAALDWLVAKCEGRKPGTYGGVVRATAHPDCPDSAPMFGPELRYSTDWAQGGPIIEREHIGFNYYHVPIHPSVQPRWEAQHGSGVFEYGPTALIAAMRCYVAAKLGDEVEVPEELL